MHASPIGKPCASKSLTFTDGMTPVFDKSSHAPNTSSPSTTSILNVKRTHAIVNTSSLAQNSSPSPIQEQLLRTGEGSPRSARRAQRHALPGKVVKLRGGEDRRMRAVLFWTVITSLGMALLFLIAPVALILAFALIQMVVPNPAGGPWWIILVVLFAVPLTAVALIFTGTFRSLRGRG
jgi:hypothetical protein